jgi:hypothetical protein
MPGTPGNTNNTRHGLFALVGNFPRGSSAIRRQAIKARDQLERAVVAEFGEVSISNAALISRAVAWLRHSRQAAKWLKEHERELTAEQKLNYSAATALGIEKCERAIHALRLNTNPMTRFEEILREEPFLPDPQRSADDSPTRDIAADSEPVPLSADFAEALGYDDADGLPAEFELDRHRKP